MPPRQIYASMASRQERRWSKQRRRDPSLVSLTIVSLAAAATWALALLT